MLGAQASSPAGDPKARVGYGAGEDTPAVPALSLAFILLLDTITAPFIHRGN